MQKIAVLFCLLALACTGRDRAASTPATGSQELNPLGSPWGPPPNPEAEPEALVTLWGVALVHTRGYPQVDLPVIEDVFYEAAKLCEPDPLAFQVQIYIEPELFKIEDRWSAGATDGDRIWVVGHYEAFDGRVARYDEILMRELVDHVLLCPAQLD